MKKQNLSLFLFLLLLLPLKLIITACGGATSCDQVSRELSTVKLGQSTPTTLDCTYGSTTIGNLILYDGFGMLIDVTEMESTCPRMYYFFDNSNSGYNNADCYDYFNSEFSILVPTDEEYTVKATLSARCYMTTSEMASNCYVYGPTYNGGQQLPPTWSITSPVIAEGAPVYGIELPPLVFAGNSTEVCDAPSNYLSACYN